jgi:multicomponent Na+:H+ antiporter subunit G
MLLDLVTWLSLLGGVVVIVIGGVGLLRMPDFYTRLHAAGLMDTLGAGLVMFGLMLQAGFTLLTVKLILILVFLWFTSPTATHALARAALADPNNPKPLIGQVGHQETPSSKS